MIAVVGCENFQTQALLRSRNIEEDGGAREKKIRGDSSTLQEDFGQQIIP